MVRPYVGLAGVQCKALIEMGRQSISEIKNSQKGHRVNKQVIRKQTMMISLGNQVEQ